MAIAFHKPSDDFQHICEHERDFLRCSRCLADPLRVAEGILCGGAYHPVEVVRILVNNNCDSEDGHAINVCDDFGLCRNTVELYLRICDNLLSAFTLLDYARVYQSSDLLAACCVMHELGVPPFRPEKYYKNYLIGPLGLIALIAPDDICDTAIHVYSTLYLAGYLDPSIFNKRVVTLQCTDDDYTINFDVLLHHRNLVESIERLERVRREWKEKGLDEIF